MRRPPPYLPLTIGCPVFNHHETDAQGMSEFQNMNETELYAERVIA